MTTTTGSRATTAFPTFSPAGMGAGILACAWGKATISANPTAADIFTLCKLPRGAKVVGGYFSTTDIDTGTEALDIDVGIAANGVDSADPDFFTNGGVYTGDAITDLPLTNAANLRPFTGPFPVEVLGAETTVQAVFNAPANAGGTGTIFCAIYYVVA